MKTTRLNVRFITNVAIFSAISIILYVIPIFQFRISIFPSFLEFHFDEVPILIAGFAYGPLAAFLVTLVKTIIKLPNTSTLTVGELADFLYSLAFVLPAAIFYKKHKTMKGIAQALSIGFICQIIVSSLFNSLFMIDFYLFLFKMDPKNFLAGLHAVNPLITDLKFTLIIWGIIPFNITKNIIVIIFSMIIYKRIKDFMEKK